jgi:hypothetical protein
MVGMRCARRCRGSMFACEQGIKIRGCREDDVYVGTEEVSDPCQRRSYTYSDMIMSMGGSLYSLHRRIQLMEPYHGI